LGSFYFYFLCQRSFIGISCSVTDMPISSVSCSILRIFQKSIPSDCVNVIFCFPQAVNQTLSEANLIRGERSELVNGRLPNQADNDFVATGVLLPPFPLHAQLVAAQRAFTDMGVWQGVAMDFLELHPGPPCPTLLCLYGRFRGGPSAEREAFGHLLPLWTPHAVRLFLQILR
jgi:hypothetical protein